MQISECGGFPTSWSVNGTGARQALMIHCSLASQRAWNGVIEQLSQVGEFTSFDLPGHGNSGDWDGRGEFQTISTAMAKDFLNAPFDLIGHSFGATVALRLAVENPELVRSLTLVEPVYFAAIRGTAAFDEHEKDFAGFVRAMEAGEDERATWEFTQLWGDGTPWEQHSERQRSSAIKRIHLISAHAGAIYDDPAGVLAPGRLEQLDIPVLLLDGGKSPPVINAIQERLFERLPNAKRLIVDDARHMLPITHPVVVAAAINEFWTENPVT